MKHIHIYIAIAILSSCSENKNKINESNKKTDSDKDVTITIKEPQLGGYNELANDDSLDRFAISEYNTDLEETINIERPSKSSIENSKFHKDKLFGIWVQDPVQMFPMQHLD